MKFLKVIIVMMVLLVQRVNFCAEGGGSVSYSLPPQVTLVVYGKGIEEVPLNMMIGGELQTIPSGRFKRVKSGKIDHIASAELMEKFQFFDELFKNLNYTAGIDTLEIELECDFTALQKVLFDYHIGGVSDSDFTMVDDAAYRRVIKLLHPFKEARPTLISTEEPMSTDKLLEKNYSEVNILGSDGIVFSVSQMLLMENFDYFNTYFRNGEMKKFGPIAPAEVTIDGNIQDINFLLL